MNWKEQLDQRYKDIDKIYIGMGGWIILKDFISTEIIEKLIQDIPDGTWTHEASGMTLADTKQQLRDKWL